MTKEWSSLYSHTEYLKGTVKFLKSNIHKRDYNTLSLAKGEGDKLCVYLLYLCIYEISPEKYITN